MGLLNVKYFTAKVLHSFSDHNLAVGINALKRKHWTQSRLTHEIPFAKMVNKQSICGHITTSAHGLLRSWYFNVQWIVLPPAHHQVHFYINAMFSLQWHVVITCHIHTNVNLTLTVQHVQSQAPTICLTWSRLMSSVFRTIIMTSILGKLGIFLGNFLIRIPYKPLQTSKKLNVMI